MDIRCSFLTFLWLNGARIGTLPACHMMSSTIFSLSLSLAIPTHRQLIENSAAHYRTVEILLLKGPWAAPPTPEAPPPVSEVPPPIINRRLKPPIRKY